MSNGRTHVPSALTALVALVLGTVIAAAPVSADTTTVHFLNINPNPLQTPYYKEHIAAFEKQNPDIKIEYNEVPYGEAHQKLVLMIQSKTPVDLTPGREWTAEFAAMGGLVDMAPFFDKWSEKSELTDVFWKLARVYKGKTYFAPVSAMPDGLYYRKDLFDKAGLKPPTTWETFLTAAKTLRDPKNSMYGYSMRGAAGGHSYMLAFMMAGAGGESFFDNAGNFMLDTPQGREGLKFYAELFWDHLTPPTAPTDGYLQMIQAFAAGRTAMYIHNASSVAELTKQMGVDGPWATTRIPAGPKGSYTFPTGWGYYMYEYGQSAAQKQATFKVLASLLSRDGTLDWNVKTGGIPTRKDALADPSFASNAKYAPFIAALADTKHAVPMPEWLPEWAGLVASFFPAETQKMLLKKQSVEETAAIIAKTLSADQKKYLAGLK
jgi:multiple sugar transport system substrate-binding protein